VLCFKNDVIKRYQSTERIEMRNSKQIWILLIVALVVFGAYQQGRLNADSAVAPAKIGVVNVTKVLENCQKQKEWQEKMQAGQTEMKKQFDQMKQELDAVQANLKLRTPGSEDYLKLQQEMMEKSAMMEAKDSFYQEKVTAEIQRWTEELYQQLLKVAESVAQSKGLDIIIADELLDVPAPTLRDFMLTIKTKKLLYHNSQYDLTDEVLAALDKAD
jgi:Skp family chaperone for outer membrane proteins